MDEEDVVNTWCNNLDVESHHYRDLADKFEKQDKSCNRSKAILFSAGLIGSTVTLAGIFSPDTPELVTAGVGLSSAAIGLVAAANIADTVIKRKIINEAGKIALRDRSSVWKAFQYMSKTAEAPIAEDKARGILKTVEYLEELLGKESISAILKAAISIKVYFDKLIEVYHIILRGSSSVSVVDEDVASVMLDEIQSRGGITTIQALYLYIKTSLSLSRSSRRSEIKVSAFVVVSLFVVYLTQLISSLRARRSTPSLVTAMRKLANTMAPE